MFLPSWLPLRHSHTTVCLLFIATNTTLTSGLIEALRTTTKLLNEVHQSKVDSAAKERKRSTNGKAEKRPSKDWKAASPGCDGPRSIWSCWSHTFDLYVALSSWLKMANPCKALNIVPGTYVLNKCRSKYCFYFFSESVNLFLIRITMRTGAKSSILVFVTTVLTSIPCGFAGWRCLSLSLYQVIPWQLFPIASLNHHTLTSGLCLNLCGPTRLWKWFHHLLFVQ
jgi:hypothetical protein